MGDDAGFEKTVQDAIAQFNMVLEVDSENVTAHANLAAIYSLIGDAEKEQHYRTLHTRYKPDDNAGNWRFPLPVGSIPRPIMRLRPCHL